VPGETLGEALKRGPLSSERVASVIGAVASALDHAHAHGVLHRDVKPGNILLREDGAVKLADLGIATAAEQTRITTSGTLLGTAAYMAPEQLEGGEATPRSDVYSLAAVAFEALGGRRARLGATPLEVAHQIATEPPPDLREACPDAPPELADVLARGMARAPEERPESAGELAAGLRRPLLAKRGPDAPDTAEMPARKTERAPAPAPVPRPRPAARRARPTWLPGAALAALLLAAAIAVVVMGGGNPESGDGERADRSAQERRQAQRQERRRSAAAERREEESAPAESAPEESAPAESAPAEAPVGSAEDGVALNAEGYELMQQGRYDEAIPILERAVAAFPEGTTDLDYAYALFNLGRSLRLAGRFEEAIPILERRLEIPNQTETVQAELDAARGSSKHP
jgi:eukaryotic-like serine/threonine-protein kinase